jgi:hypothetical protein
MQGHPPGFLFRIWTIAALILGAAPALAFDEVGAVNPDLADRLCESGGTVTYLARDKSYRLVLPALGKKVYLADRDVTRNVSAHMEMSEWTNGFLFIVSTRIPDDTGSSAVLDRVEQRFQPYAERFKDAYVSRRGEGKFGRTFEFELLNVSANGRIPYPLNFHMPANARPEVIERLAVHRFFVAEGMLYEVVVMLHTKKQLAGLSRSELAARADQWLALTMAGFIPGKTESCAAPAKDSVSTAVPPPR